VYPTAPELRSEIPEPWPSGAKVFDARRNKRGIRWPLDIKPPEIEDWTDTRSAKWNELRSTNDLLYEYYVEGAPIIIDANVKVERNIVNGSVGTFHSIVWSSEGNNFTTEKEFASAREKAE